MSRRSAKWVLFLVILNIAAAQSDTTKPAQPGSAPAPAQADGPPVLRTTTNLVLIDVVVRDKKTGHPVDGLDRLSFQLLEDGHPQTLTVFEEHRATDAIQASPVPHLPPHVYGDFPRYAIRSAANVLLIDALNTKITDQSYARQQLIRYLRTIPPGTYVAIFMLGSDLRMVTGLTTDLNTVLAALGKKTGSAGVSAAGGGTPDDAASTEPDFETGSAQGMDQAMQDFARDTRNLTLQIRRDMTVAALKKLARFLGTVPGRKNLIWMSAGFPVPLGDPEGDRFEGDFFLRVREIDELMAHARVAIYPVDARGLMTLPNLNADNGSGGGGPISSMRGVSSGGFPNGNPIPQAWAGEHMTMQEMAEETGGKAFYNTNAIGQSAVSAIADGSTYYTLGYDPTNHKFNGAFRKVKVTVEDKQYDLSYRRGYDAVDPSGADKATHPLSPMSAAMLRGGLPLSEVIFEARVLPAGDPLLAGQKPVDQPAGKPDRPLREPVTRYVIDYSIDPHRLTLTNLADGRRRAELEIAQSVLDRDGARVNQSDTGMEVNLTPQELSRSYQAGIHLRQEIDVPAGDTILRLGVRDASSERIGTIEIPLRAGEMDKKPQ